MKIPRDRRAYPRARVGCRRSVSTRQVIVVSRRCCAWPRFSQPCHSSREGRRLNPLFRQTVILRNNNSQVAPFVKKS